MQEGVVVDRLEGKGSTTYKLNPYKFSQLIRGICRYGIVRY